MLVFDWQLGNYLLLFLLLCSLNLVLLSSVLGALDLGEYRHLDSEWRESGFVRARRQDLAGLINKLFSDVYTSNELVLLCSAEFFSRQAPNQTSSKCVF